MGREQKLSAIILKKQPLGEGDELLTLFTKDQGKLRVLAKSIKSPKSKLQQKLQVLFRIEAVIAGSKIPKIIGAETVDVYLGIRENLLAAKIAFLAVELILKFTAEEQKNEKLFSILQLFFEFLSANTEPLLLDMALARFKLAVLEASGFGLRAAPDASAAIYFNSALGGFASNAAGSVRVSAGAYKLFLSLLRCKLADLSGLEYPTQNALGELQNLLTSFIEYQLERKLKAENFLRT